MSSLCRPGCFLIVIILMCRGTFHHMSQFSCVVSGGPCLAKTSTVVPEVTISQLFLLKNILPRTDSGALLLIAFLWQLNEITTFLFLIRDLLDYTRLMNKLQNQITKKTHQTFVSKKKAKVIMLKLQKPVGDYIVVMSIIWSPRAIAIAL